MSTLRLRITGRVQGVGFRDAMRREALHLGVRGWVRNRRDGSVEAVVQGSEEAVDAMLTWTRRGPAAARVADVVAAPATGEDDRPYAGFDWLPSG
jgi:acylphosphatase